MALDLLPRTVLSRPEAARRRVALVVAAATGAVALAGLWFRTEDGLGLRFLVAVTSAIFGWLTIDVALSAKGALGAALRALGTSIVLGAANTTIPVLIVSRDRSLAAVPFGLPYGGIFGATVGLVYGLVLAVVAAATFRQVAAGTHDGADRAVRIASGWTILPLALIALAMFGHDFAHIPEWAIEWPLEAHASAVPYGLLGFGVVLSVATASFVTATRKLTARRRWLLHVVSGIDPRWGVREIAPHDDLGSIPRLGTGSTVVERKNEHAIYRTTATGEAVALI